MSHSEPHSPRMSAAGDQRQGAGLAAGAGRRGGIAALPGMLLVPSCLLLLLTSLVFGGGTRGGFIGDAIIQFVALPCLAVIAIALVQNKGAGIRVWEYVLCLAILAVPAWQVWPVSPSIWADFPGQRLRLDALSLLGREPLPMALSLSPDSTRLAALSLIPVIGFYFGMRQLTVVQRNRCVIAIVGFGLLSVFLGLAQLAGGPESPLRFYSVTNRADAVGFFANRNHLAALLYVSFLLSAAWIIDALLALSTTSVQGTSRQRLLIILAICFTVAFLLGSAQILTRSRAGVGLTVLAVIFIGFVALADQRNKWRGSSLMLLGVLAVGALLFATQAGLNNFLERVRFDPLNDTRLTVWNATIAGIRDFWPLGTGIGSFEKVFPLYETARDLISNVYINHAHNDYTEVLLEAGLPASIVFFGLCIWLIRCAFGVFSRPQNHVVYFDLLVRRVAFFAVIILSLHSFVDYPLRTSALLAVFALLLAIVAPTQNPSLRENTK